MLQIKRQMNFKEETIKKNKIAREFEMHEEKEIT